LLDRTAFDKLAKKVTMKTYKLTLIAGLAFLGLAFASSIDDKKEKYPSLEIGAKAPMQKALMKDVSGKEIHMEGLKQKNGLLVVFSCNTCPFVVGGETLGEGWEGRYNDLYDYATQHQMGMVLINSNEAKREGADAYDRMKDRAKEKGYKMSYVVDENSKLANAFGAKTTPHVYLFDGDFKLQYKGAIDDNNKNASKVEKHYLKDAIKELASGKKVSVPETKNLGCSIKRTK
jgi:thioredoxin-related protein